MRRPRAAALTTAVAVVTAALLTAPTAHATPTTPATGAATVVPIQVTGDPATRFNLVILGDGYRAGELATFRRHVDHHLNVLWTLEPFRSYRNYLNVYAVEVPSPESGVDCDPGLDAPRRDTPLGMGFWGGCDPASVQRLLTVDGAAATRYADLVPGTTTDNRQILAVANSPTYGGAGGSLATVSGGNALSALITPHELGHSLGGLDDEYDYYQRGVRGGPYRGGEPESIHHTLLTEREMAEQQRKWWRWLGEPSESGGVIGRYEGGRYSGTGVWRPSEHSLMKTLGYYFDQVSRERLTQRIAAKTRILQDGTPNDRPVGADRVLWVRTLHPLSHELDVTWAVDGTPVPTAHSRGLDLRALDLSPGRHTVTATVVDPTEFVRDPAIRSSAALTQVRRWTVDTALTTPPAPTPVAFTHTTPRNAPVGATDVVYADTTHPNDRVPRVTWALDGRPVANPGNDRDLDLKDVPLTPGRHTLTATVRDPAAAASAETVAWTVDATGPATRHELSPPLLTVRRPGAPPEYIMNGPFTMSLTARDDSPGYVVREFRTDGDGWYHYFGWPTDPGAPFRFTADGTEIDGLVYGKLGRPRLSPWDDVPPGYGRHTIDYRAIDPAGNVGGIGRFVVTLLPEPPTCTTTVTGRHEGPLTVAAGTTCLTGATVNGPVTVGPGAALVATDATVTGPVLGSGARVVQLLRSTVRGPVRIAGTTEDVTIVGGRVRGPLELTGNATGDRAATVAGTAVTGPLSCSGNVPAPTSLHAPSTVTGPATGQCATFDRP
ncbi:M64 family metallopeptidase [Amycolatopsis arida]|nr:M64 family metallopeptidase [Amycolatopsis arida]